MIKGKKKFINPKGKMNEDSRQYQDQEHRCDVGNTQGFTKKEKAEKKVAKRMLE